MIDCARRIKTIHRSLKKKEHTVSANDTLSYDVFVAGHKNKALDDAARVIAETGQYLDDVDDLLPKNSSARDFFNAMLQRYPNRRLGATTLWAGTRSLYALRDRRGGKVLHESLAGWL